MLVSVCAVACAGAASGRIILGLNLALKALIFACSSTAGSSTGVVSNQVLLMCTLSGNHHDQGGTEVEGFLQFESFALTDVY
jgi:hypothetical protein